MLIFAKKKKNPNFTFLGYFAISSFILPRRKIFYYNSLTLSKNIKRYFSVCWGNSQLNAHGRARWASRVAQREKSLPAMQEMQEIRLQFLGWEDPLEEGTATRSSILAWKVSWTEEPGELQSIDSNESDTTEAAEHTHMQARQLLLIFLS